MSSLPGLLGDIADVVGPEVALEIARAVGGTRISIPPRAEPEHWLTELVGIAAADKICRGLATLDPDNKRMRGVSDEILPLGSAKVLARAKRRAQDLLDDGKSVTQAARASGLHERTIWRMKAQDSSQLDLFKPAANEAASAPKKSSSNIRRP